MCRIAKSDGATGRIKVTEVVANVRAIRHRKPRCAFSSGITVQPLGDDSWILNKCYRPLPWPAPTFGAKTIPMNTHTNAGSTTLKLSALLLLATMLTSCYSVRRSVERSRPNSAKIQWPDAYQPEEARFFIHNEIDVEGSPEAVWEVLIAAETWPEWYEGAKDVKVTSNTTGALEAEAVFSWSTMGQDFVSIVEEFEPPYRLSWVAEKKSIRGYHAWLIIPTDSGCRIVTSETQHGFLTLMQKMFVPRKLEKLHDVWLGEIKRKVNPQNSP